MVATMTFLPFIVSSSVMTLTALDFLASDAAGSPRSVNCCRKARPIAGAVARLHRIFRRRHHAVAADLHRRSPVRDAFDPRKTQVNRMDAGNQPLLDVATCRWRSSAQRHLGRGRSYFLRIKRAECGGAVGESGSGKSVSALSILKLLPYPIHRTPRKHSLQGPRTAGVVGARDSRHSRKRHYRYLPGTMTSLNPLHTIESRSVKSCSFTAGFAGRWRGRGRLSS